MRISILLIIFLLLFNGWGALLQDYGIDEQLGINAETGDADALEQAETNAGNVSTGEAVGQTLLGFYNNLLQSLKGILTAWEPGLQLLVNVVPAGIGEDIVIWAFSIMKIVIFVDFLAYARGVDL